MRSFLTIVFEVILAISLLCTHISFIILKRKKNRAFREIALPPQFYITGDKHGQFNGVIKFCREKKTRKKDVLIILGDIQSKTASTY